MYLVTRDKLTLIIFSAIKQDSPNIRCFPSFRNQIKPSLTNYTKITSFEITLARVYPFMSVQSLGPILRNKLMHSL